MTFSALEQTIHARRAKELLTTTLPIFKSVRGTIQHDDLAEVSEDQHHEKTTSFSELEDEATDAQIPNDITVNFAAMAGDADTLNGVFAVELEESLEIDADIAAHAGQASAHHAKYTDADAVAANAALFKALERRLECLENPQYLDRGDGTVYECESDLVWLKRANCSGSKKWDSAKSWAANLADGACGLSDGSSAGDWRLPTKAEWQGMFDDAAAAGCTNGPRVANTTGTGCWTEGDPFSGIGTLGYWTSERPRSSRAWEARVESATFRSVPTKWVSNDAWVVRAER